MNFTEVVYYIENSMRFGCRPGLERTAKLLELLGNPHKAIKTIHVAGTNGKGSTTAMLVSILTQAGYNTGMYTSPHLYKITERMTINNKEISEADFTAYAERVINTMKLMEEKGLEQPTQFEMLTAMAFLYFTEKKVDIAVIEVGLGGAYDATNVIEADLCVITSISYDHMDILGNTIEEIAREKAGIIKKNSVAVMYPQNYTKAADTIENKCMEMNAKLVKVSEKLINIKKSDEYGHVFDYINNEIEYINIKLPLIGDHQLKNAAVVLSAIIELKKLGYVIEEQHIKEGLETVKWPCRLSVVSTKPIILIDGAHNDEGVDSLKAALKKYFGTRNMIFVFGMLKDKSYGYAVKELMPIASSVIATQPISSRALSAEELAVQVREFCSDVVVKENIIEAVEKAKSMCDENSMICVCGSLYLAGSVYEYILSK